MGRAKASKSSGSKSGTETKGQKKTMERVMHEFKHGELKSGGSGKPVRSRAQAVAIGLSEAGASKDESPAKNKRNLQKTKSKEAKGETAQQELEGDDAMDHGPTKLQDKAKKRGVAGRTTLSKAKLEKVTKNGAGDSQRASRSKKSVSPKKKAASPRKNTTSTRKKSASPKKNASSTTRNGTASRKKATFSATKKSAAKRAVASRSTGKKAGGSAKKASPQKPASKGKKTKTPTKNKK